MPYSNEFVMPPRGETMPKTIEALEARAQRDQELILEMKGEISKLKQTVNKLNKKFTKSRARNYIDGWKD